MRPVKQTTAAATIVLDERIARAVGLQRQVDALTEQLKGEREAIKSTMEEAGFERHGTKDGHEALMIDSEVFTWNADALTEKLSRSEIEELLPRKPEGKLLRQKWESDEEFNARVKGCFKKSKKVALELRAGAPIERAVDEALRAKAPLN